MGTLGGIGELAREALGKGGDIGTLPTTTGTPTVRRTRNPGDAGGA
jgi:hypothetical protein